MFGNVTNEYKGMICQGDSGGPLTIKENGRYYLFIILIILLYKCTVNLNLICNLSRHTLIGVVSFNMLKTSADGKRKICDPEFMPQVYKKSMNLR